MIASVSAVASTVSWPGRAWSEWPWLTTAVATGRKRVDEEAAGAAVEALGADLEPGLGVGAGHGVTAGELDIRDIFRISSG